MANNPSNQTFTVAAIPELRSGLTFVQQRLINAIWQRHLSEGKPYPRRALADVTGALKDEEIFKGLNAGLLYETSLQGNETAYQLTFYGALLTDDGATLAEFLRLLIRIIRESHRGNRYDEELSKEEIVNLLRSSPLVPVSWASAGLNVMTERLNLALKLFILNVPHTLPFFLGEYSPSGASWTIRTRQDVRELDLTEDPDVYLDERLAAGYNPSEPVSLIERSSPRRGRQGVNNPLPTSAINSAAATAMGGGVPEGPLAYSSLASTRTETEATYDLLGRETVTQALRHLLIEREDVEPFAIGLFGHWGSGKSSQVRFLRDELKKSDEPRVLVAEYNAWKHEKATNVGVFC